MNGKWVCGFIISLIFGYALNIWIWTCDCQDNLGCDEYNWELECPASQAGCVWDDNKNKCVKECDCGWTNITPYVRSTLGWIFGVPTFGGTLGFIIWMYKCGCKNDQTRRDYNYHELDSYL